MHREANVKRQHRSRFFREIAVSTRSLMRKRLPSTSRATRYSGLLWLNEAPDALGSYWHSAQNERQRHRPQNVDRSQYNLARRDDSRALAQAQSINRSLTSAARS
jgi:hypothetical protein